MLLIAHLMRYFVGYEGYEKSVSEGSNNLTASQVLTKTIPSVTTRTGIGSCQRILLGLNLMQLFEAKVTRDFRAPWPMPYPSQFHPRESTLFPRLPLQWGRPQDAKCLSWCNKAWRINRNFRGVEKNHDISMQISFACDDLEYLDASSLVVLIVFIVWYSDNGVEHAVTIECVNAPADQGAWWVISDDEGYRSRWCISSAWRAFWFDNYAECVSSTSRGKTWSNTGRMS